MPRGFVIGSPRYAQRPLVYPYANGSLGIEVVYIHIGVGLRRCSFRHIGPFLRASEREASDSAGLHAFLCLELTRRAHNKTVIRSP